MIKRRERGGGLQGAELLASWLAAKERSLTQSEHATEIGMPLSKYQSRLWRAQQGADNSASQSPVDVPDAPAIDEEIKVTPDGNGGLSIEGSGDRIKSVAALLKECEVDLEKYTVGPSSVRKWDVVLKNAIGEPNIVQAFYVSAGLMPKKIPQSELDIKPVFFTAGVPRLAKLSKASGRGLILTDVQAGFRRNVLNGKLDPFHDRAALDVALQIAQVGEFDRVTWLGDILDLSEFSDKFVREPGFYFTAQPAIYETHWWMQQFVFAQPDADHDALEGNHDYRLPLALYNHVLAMHNLQPATAEISVPSMSVPALLSFDELEIKYLDGYPNNETWQGPVRIIHGDIARNTAGATAGALVSSAQDSTIQGHIHRIEQASKTINARGKIKTIQAVSPGCLCRIDYVVPGHKSGQQWQQGIAVVEWDRDYSTITPIPIRDGVAIYQGKVYRARPRVDDLNRDTASVRDGWRF